MLVIPFLFYLFNFFFCNIFTLSNKIEKNKASAHVNKLKYSNEFFILNLSWPNGLKASENYISYSINKFFKVFTKQTLTFKLIYITFS